jgi:transposase
VETSRSGDRVALEGVRIIARMFGVGRESTCPGDTAEQRRARRDQYTRPILDELRAWVDQQSAVTPPKTPLGQGLGYLDRQWKRLLLFLEDGYIEATNNRRERELRRLADDVSLCAPSSSTRNLERAIVSRNSRRATGVLATAA